MHLQKGKQYFDQDELQKARAELEAAYYLRPQDEKVLNMLGMTYYKLEMLPEAEAMYVVLAATNPDVYALQSNLGLIQLKLRKLSAARESLNRALELQPSNSKAHFYMGLLCEKEGLWDDALNHFEEAHAEKMVGKMRAKMEEARNKPELVLPFEVVEVMESSTAQIQEPDLDSFVSEEMRKFQEEDAEITGKMRVPDLAEAMFQIHQEETEHVAEPEIASEPPQSYIENPIQEDLPPVFLEPQGTLTPEEEIAGDKAQDSMAEEMSDEIRNEASMWEKTHPSLFPEQFSDTGVVAGNDSNFLIGSAVDEPFLLSEEIAADISTFLAQSRTDENVEEDVFYNEPAAPELTIIRGTQSEEVEEARDVAQDSRIPTPEEVENEVAETPIEPNSQEASILDQLAASLKQQEEALIMPEVGPAEEFSNEISVESEQATQQGPEQPQEQEEDLEVNFAVNDSDEDGQVQQGFLEPSPLTPDLEEKELEQTQDMADAMPVSAESKISQNEQAIGEPIGEPIVSDAASVLEAVPAEVPEAPAMEVPEATAVEVPEMTAVEMPEATATEDTKAERPVEVFRPANLDQFSKDRLYIQPLVGSDRFLLIDPHLLEIIISDQLICRIGTISSYTGTLQFLPIVEQTNEKLPLIQVTGSGILFLADRRKEIFLISLNNEVIYVESNHLLVAQSTLKIEPQYFKQKTTTADNFAVIKISGRGTLALTCQTKPLTVNVHEGLPANIPAQAVIAWSGNVESEVMDDEDLRKVMMTANDDSLFLRFHGSGDVVVEQGGLWGDRRTRRP